MIDRVLVAMDDTEMGESVLEHALEAHPDAEITVLHVVGVPSGTMGEAMGLAVDDDIGEAATEQAEPVLERAREIAREHGRTIRTEIKAGSPAKAIVDRAGAFDTVVIGSHEGTVVERLFVGNVARKVFQHAPVPVTVVR